MVCVQWINLIVDEVNNHTTIGHIPLTDWMQWPLINPVQLNPFIRTTNLRPSRYALTYEAIRPGIVYVDTAFIPLDSENLSEANADTFHHDFGDNRFPYFHGDSNTRLQDNQQDDDEEEIQLVNASEEFQSLKAYIPESVLRFLTT